MAQHDYVIANGTGAAVRSDLNSGLAAIVSQNSGATEPTTTYAYMRWADTATGVMKMRNGANNAWITLYQLDGEWSTIAFENGSAAAPSIYFKDSGTDTGIYSPGADQVAISTGGTGRLFVSSAGLVGIGTSSPDASYRATIAGSRSGVAPGIFFSDTDASPNNYSLYIDGAKNFVIRDTTSNLNRITVTPAGLVGIGTTTPQGKLIVSNGGANGLEFFPDTDSGVNSTINSYNRSSSAFSALTINAAQYIFLTASSEAARIDSSKRLLVGTSSARSWAGVTSQTQVEGAATYVSQSIVANSADTVGGLLALGKSRGTALGSHTVVQSGDILGRIYFVGADGSALIQGATITAEVDGTPGANDMPGRLVFSTTADGASSPTERMRITSTGEIWTGTNMLQRYNNNSLSSWSYDTGTSTGVMVFVNLGTAGDGAYQGVSLGKSATSWGTYSDERGKTNLAPIENGLLKVSNLRAVTGRYLEDKEHTSRSFLIAQDVQAVLPEAVDNGDPDKLTLRYTEVIPLLVAALKESKERIEALEAKVAALEAA